MKNNGVFDKLQITNSFYSRVVKRFFDFTLSLFAIIVLSPILLLIYLLTIIFLGAPGIYKQSRPGKNHRVFNIYKFRSMTNKKDENGVLLPDEKRITWFGKLLRKSSLDELPQLFNILKGDMSIIGPRPRLVKDMVFYDREVYDYYIVKPGLTGPTQAYGRNRNTWEQVFEKDIAYSHNITFLNDLKILFKTFTSIFFDKGESHSNSEENKNEKSKEQEYYYADYLLRTQKITRSQYDLGLMIARRIIEGSGYIGYYPEIHSGFNGLIFTDFNVDDGDNSAEKNNSSPAKDSPPQDDKPDALDETNSQAESNKTNINSSNTNVDITQNQTDNANSQDGDDQTQADTQ